ncbi:unnamed protein product [Acanthosepion pharaonis]|uniref:Uncharacterized protein n=1 Tax=Acanthosepion pharaonis TaxID=158019 RepID=A0A812BGR8_ACAPH|nr:unnamed protein product [Sepia pharaonis]
MEWLSYVVLAGATHPHQYKPFCEGWGWLTRQNPTFANSPQPFFFSTVRPFVLALSSPSSISYQVHSSVNSSLQHPGTLNIVFFSSIIFPLGRIGHPGKLFSSLQSSFRSVELNIQEHCFLLFNHLSARIEHPGTLFSSLQSSFRSVRSVEDIQEHCFLLFNHLSARIGHPGTLFSCLQSSFRSVELNIQEHCFLVFNHLSRSVELDIQEHCFLVFNHLSARDIQEVFLSSIIEHPGTLFSCLQSSFRSVELDIQEHCFLVFNHLSARIGHPGTLFSLSSIIFPLGRIEHPGTLFSCLQSSFRSVELNIRNIVFLSSIIFPLGRIDIQEHCFLLSSIIFPLESEHPGTLFLLSSIIFPLIGRIEHPGTLFSCLQSSFRSVELDIQEHCFLVFNHLSVELTSRNIVSFSIIFPLVRIGHPGTLFSCLQSSFRSVELNIQEHCFLCLQSSFRSVELDIQEHCFSFFNHLSPRGHPGTFFVLNHLPAR